MIIFLNKILDLISMKALIKAAIITTAYIMFILLIKRLIIYIVNANLPFRLKINFSSMCVKTVGINLRINLGGRPNLRIPNLGGSLNPRIPVPILLAILSWPVKLSILLHRRTIT